MKIHIAVVTLGKQDMIDRLFSPVFWQSVQPLVESVVVLSQLQPVIVSRPGHARLDVGYSEENLGCAGGRAYLTRYLLDHGLKRDDMIIYLDDDVEVMEDRQTYWVADLCSPLLRHYSISGVAGRRVTEDYLTEETMELHPDYVSGGWCAIRGDVFHDGCMFDEQFYPNYWEDVDLCYQAREKGKYIIAVGNIGLRHEHPATIDATQHVSENRQRFIAKWQNRSKV